MNHSVFLTEPHKGHATYRLVKMSKCRNVELLKCRDIEMCCRVLDVDMSKCRDVEMSSCRDVEKEKLRMLAQNANRLIAGS